MGSDRSIPDLRNISIQSETELPPRQRFIGFILNHHAGLESAAPVAVHLEGDFDLRCVERGVGRPSPGQKRKKKHEAENGGDLHDYPYTRGAGLCLWRL